MPHQHNDLELAIVRMAAQEYGDATGLSAGGIRRDEHSLWIDWLYADGTWAGTSSYDQPLHQVIDKLHHEIEHEWQRIDPGMSQLCVADPKPYQLEMAV